MSYIKFQKKYKHYIDILDIIKLNISSNAFTIKSETAEFHRIKSIRVAE